MVRPFPRPSDTATPPPSRPPGGGVSALLRCTRPHALAYTAVETFKGSTCGGRPFALAAEAGFLWPVDGASARRLEDFPSDSPDDGSAPFRRVRSCWPFLTAASLSTVESLLSREQHLSSSVFCCIDVETPFSPNRAAGPPLLLGGGGFVEPSFSSEVGASLSRDVEVLFSFFRRAAVQSRHFSQRLVSFFRF